MPLIIEHNTPADASFSPAGETAWEEPHKITGEPDGAVPVGGIIMWSGTIAAIPSPIWELCDGTANAPGPDLRDKFIVGASADDAGVAKSTVEGVAKQTGGVTAVQHSAHGDLAHAGMVIGDHTGLTHGLSIGNHPDLTHAALSHPAQTLSHGDHAIASFSGTVASRADLSRPSASHSHPAVANISIPSGSIASRADLSGPSRSIASRADLSGPSRTIASRADLSNPSASIASRADISGPSGSFASHAAGSIPSGSVTIASGTHSHAAVTLSGSVTATLSMRLGSAASPTVLVLSPSTAPGLTVTQASTSGTHASATGSIASAANASGPSGSIASHAAGSMPSLTIASNAAVSMPSVTLASHAAGSMPSLTLGSHAAGSLPSLTVASNAAGSAASSSGTMPSGADVSMPSLSHSHAGSTLSHADHSLASLSHQDIGTHKGTDYGTHAFTAPAAHGVAGTLAHSFSEPDDHTISAHDEVLSLPVYFALAFIQRMA